ncbi:ABC transporter permease [Micromonospora echinofusca]|uniref:ABC transporter permease n=1 Tax=Micromonospora echinofusca TaxID=47858 RepID=A0ABS3VYJ3_MICEH|nr:ABC transporter permease [Micromonospora echinofusca]MBO4209615.1 ABC transporter permease [Micromonospora echinofusca]
MLLEHTLKVARLDFTVLLRNRTAFFTTIAFPVLLGGMTLGLDEGVVEGLPVGLYLLTGMLALVGFFVTFAYLTSLFTVRREDLVLKRMRGSLLSEVAILGGSGLTCTVIYVVQAAVVVTIGVVGLGGAAPRNVPLLLLTVVLTSIMFVPLAAALSGVTRTGESAQITVLPVLLVLAGTSQAAFPLGDMPELVQRLSAAMPLSPVVDVIRIAYFGRDFTDGTAPYPAVGFAESWSAAAPGLLLILGWTVVGVLFARRYFRWEPRNA